MRLEGMSIVVTGGMGFVGSHTVKSLRSMGAYVITLDRRLVEGREKLCNKFIQGDYGSKEVLDQLHEHRPHGIVHCAGSSLVGPSIKDPSDYYNNNVANTLTMLDHIKEWQWKPFIVFSSSAAVYGDPIGTPIDEDTPKYPISPYGRSKLMIEELLNDYSVAYGIRSHSLRYFNACGADVWDHELGPEAFDTHLIPQMFSAICNDHPFTLYGTDYDTPDGTCIRDYIHVCDLALAHGTSCEALQQGAETGSYNLGTNQGYSNLEIINRFGELVANLKVFNDVRRPGDPDRLIADANLYQSKFNWKPNFSTIDSIISSTNEYYINKR